MKEILRNSVRVLLETWSAVVHALGGCWLDILNSLQSSPSGIPLVKKFDLQQKLAFTRRIQKGDITLRFQP